MSTNALSALNRYDGGINNSIDGSSIDSGMTEIVNHTGGLVRGERFDRLSEVFQALTGRRAARILFPGGKGRKSAVVVTDEDAMFVITRRRHAGRAELETEVLRELKQQGAPVPAIIARDGKWIVQEHLGEVRLSEAIDAASPAARRVLLRAATESLIALHQAGRRAGLERRVILIGKNPSWLETLVDMPLRIGEYLAMPTPALPREAVMARLVVEKPAFIKWDARPGNAAVRPDGTVAWFDWEHCGCRAPLDDLGWLLGDEWSPDDPLGEGDLLEIYLADFAGDKPAAARDYLMTFGTLHMCVRLSLILSRKDDGDWWDRGYCLVGDKIGVTLQEATKVAGRAGRWSAASSLLAPLSPWFKDIADRVQEL
ncbi:MAG: phosphotransferase [Proteobacteria bacterium]|nr:phosphotransferase [Pseudomonadota bacterium]